MIPPKCIRMKENCTSEMRFQVGTGCATVYLPFDAFHSTRPAAVLPYTRGEFQEGGSFKRENTLPSTSTSPGRARDGAKSRSRGRYWGNQGGSCPGEPGWEDHVQ